MGMWCRGLTDSCDAFIPHTVGTDICATTWFRQHGAFCARMWQCFARQSTLAIPIIATLRLPFASLKAVG